MSRDQSEVREQARHISRAGSFLAERRQVEGPKKGDFPGCPVVKIQASNAGVRVRSLVRELRSYMPHDVAKKLKERKKESPKEGLTWHIPGEEEISGAGVSKQESDRDETGEEGRGQRVQGFGSF